jgi:hypothetical protein
MMEKDEYVRLIKEIRLVLASGKEARCSCPKTKCEWHGDCYSCVRIHRHFGEHVPDCLKFVLRGKVREIARAAGMTAEEKPATPDEYWDHVRRVAPPGKRCQERGEERDGREP